MNDVDLALDQISSIRAQLAANTRYLLLSPEFNLLVGVIALLVASFQASYFPPQSDLNCIIVWSAVFVAATGISVWDVVLRVRREHGGMASTILGTLLQKALPFFLAVFILTWVMCRFSTDSLWLLPGLWQILMGLLGFAALSSLPRPMTYVSAWYFLCGAVVFAVAAQTRVVSPWMLGIPFGLGQLAVGLVIARAREEVSVSK